jgi:hypothetical protein
MFVVCGQELNQTMELVCTSFPMSVVPKYVLQYCAGKISDRLPCFGYFSGFGSSLENRPNYSEDVAGLGNINDIRNGVFAAAQIHNGFDPRHIVVLKVCHICLPACPFSDPYVTANPQTPNHMLDQRHTPTPRSRRYAGRRLLSEW